MTTMEEQLIETWNIHNRINLYLLAALAPEVLGVVSPLKGRTVFQLFAHMHNVRLMWLKASAPELLEGLEKLEGSTGTHDQLRAALEASGGAVEALLRKGFAEGGRIKGFKPHAAGFLGYLVSHESHHRGQMTITLKALGHPLDNKTDYGMWEWGVR
jgi:uncharacterized damage-inducible protein DinB